MTKIVINTCFGGFGLSLAALKRAIADNAPFITRMSAAEYDGDSELGLPPSATERKDAGDGFTANWTGAALYRNGHVFFMSHSDTDRADPTLVKLVEEMGEAANGRHAELKVVEIPNGVTWSIEDYDGREHIAEHHRTWS